MHDEGELVPDEQAQHLGQRIRLAFLPLGRPVLPVKAGTKALVDLLRALALQSGIERAGEDLRLRCARL